MLAVTLYSLPNLLIVNGKKSITCLYIALIILNTSLRLTQSMDDFSLGEGVKTRLKSKVRRIGCLSKRAQIATDTHTFHLNNSYRFVHFHSDFDYWSYCNCDIHLH